MFSSRFTFFAVLMLPLVTVAQGIRVDTELFQEAQAAHSGETHHLALTVSLEQCFELLNHSWSSAGIRMSPKKS